MSTVEITRGAPHGAKQGIVDHFTRNIEAQVALHFFYRKGAGEPVELRALSPYELRTSAAGHLLVLGFDHDRQEVRHFRIERVRGTLSAPDLAFVAAEEGDEE